jgi:hypothetical protein
VTVQDVLRTIKEVLSVLLSKRELDNLGGKERTALRVKFKKRYKTEEERSKGPRRIDHLGGRDWLQILPKHSPDGGVLLPSSAPSTPAGTVQHWHISLVTRGVICGARNDILLLSGFFLGNGPENALHSRSGARRPRFAFCYAHERTVIMKGVWSARTQYVADLSARDNGLR